MVQQVVSRTQRRMEKKQALILLVLVLAVSLVSFSLGVMVGRSGTRTPVTESGESPARLPVAQIAPDPNPGEAGSPTKPEENLTFYDTLPKGQQPPLGSGINLPPKKEELKPEPTAPAAPRPEPAAKPAPVPAAVPKPAPIPPQLATTGGGSHLVQVASFPKAEDAGALKERLAKKGYDAFVERVDLGPKGIWYRVFVGPFRDAEAAGKAADRIKAEDKLSAIVRRR